MRIVVIATVLEAILTRVIAGVVLVIGVVAVMGLVVLRGVVDQVVGAVGVIVAR